MRPGAAISTSSSVTRQPEGGYAVRAYFNPLVRFIWLGALIMFIGGGISLSDRRLRVGAPTTRRAGRCRYQRSRTDAAPYYDLSRF